MLSRLKTATRQRHTALEAQMPVMDPALTPAGYRHLLQQQLGFYEPLEARLLAAPAWPDIGLEYGPRRKTPRLVSDLLFLGDSAAEIAALPRCQQLPRLDSLARLLGCLYVIEGATLGGQIITRHLQSHFGITAASGAAFFGGYGGSTGSGWKAFCALFTAHTARMAGSDSESAVLDSADQTYACLGAWMTAQPAAPKATAEPLQATPTWSPT